MGSSGWIAHVFGSLAEPYEGCKGNIAEDPSTSNHLCKEFATQFMGNAGVALPLFRYEVGIVTFQRYFSSCHYRMLGW